MQSLEKIYFIWVPSSTAILQYYPISPCALPEQSQQILLASHDDTALALFQILQTEKSIMLLS